MDASAVMWFVVGVVMLALIIGLFFMLANSRSSRAGDSKTGATHKREDRRR